MFALINYSLQHTAREKERKNESFTAIRGLQEEESLKIGLALGLDSAATTTDYHGMDDQTTHTNRLPAV